MNFVTFNDLVKYTRRLAFEWEYWGRAIKLRISSRQSGYYKLNTQSKVKGKLAPLMTSKNKTLSNNPPYSKPVTIVSYLKVIIHKVLMEPFLKLNNYKKKERYLEIGPGEERIKNFETINIIKTPATDYIGNAMKKIPFSSETFDLVYASHILEHTPWNMLEVTIKEWARVIKKGGVLEIWVPDGLKIARAFVDAETNNGEEYKNDGWFKFNPRQDPLVWAAGRIFSYGDGKGTPGHPNWHLSLFSLRYIKYLLTENGFTNVQQMTNSECRGYDHGWINLGVRAIKK